ncbi:S-adenosyl-L-methionine-dependent methyltransferase [Rhypophila decipiens]|uniref:S-adenosyl-L-methionine-dependent methyltransferase n=1 Tax=Rhypophila decipiens TaxID=261697 RepID=A0AAN6YBG6_9PEZI|nr:S-adenosyl-L-methionine-dependent methyltransferase [Rhypophila decipiens]
MNMMGSLSTSHIVELANRISANTAIIDNYLETHNLPPLSFNVDGPTNDWIHDAQPEMAAARDAVIDDTEELGRLVTGPRDHIMNSTLHRLSAYQVISRFRLAHAFPIDKEATFAEIAAASGLRKSVTRQVIRLGVVNGYFVEPRPGVVAHNVTTRMLVENPGLQDYLEVLFNESLPASAHTAEALARYPLTEEPGETGFSLANNCNDGFYDLFSKYPARGLKFQTAMKCYQRSSGFDSRHIITGYPWEEFGSGTVVDIGGSHGMVSIGLAQKYPSLSFVVQDLEAIIEGGRANLPAELAARVKFMTHDFFKEDQPIHGAAVYFYRWIFHNWSDKYSVRILRSLIPALKTGAKVIINDYVLPSGKSGFKSRVAEKRARGMDLCMAELFNSQERELDDWANLFKLADSRFEFKGAHQPDGSEMSLIVAEWKGE